MSSFPAELDRLSPARRPDGRAIGYHVWSNLLFVHWRVPTEVVRPLLPAGLTLDTWEGDALIGLVPFEMSGVRPWWSPPVPGVSSFCETNVRTYVHHRDRNPGVWFFSLDASSSLAVRIARWRWSLPYYRATMRVRWEAATIEYSSRRLWPGPADATSRIVATIGEGWNNSAGDDEARLPDTARPGTLDHFLIERYVLYAQSARGRLLMGRVHHSPYVLRRARLDQLDETLLEAARLPRPGEICHLAYSERVSVEVFPLAPVE